MQYVKCNLCGSENYIYLFSARAGLPDSEENFNIIKCKSCGLVFVNPRPEVDELSKYYSEHYFAEVAEPPLLKKFFGLNKGKLINGLKNKGKLLDVGCGRGEFLQQMEGCGWEVWGLDASPVACKYAKEKLGNGRIFNQDLLSASVPVSYFDVVTLWHVIEHLNDPLSSLKKIRQILKKDGLLVVACPNFLGYSSKIFRKKWYALMPPVHLYHFSPASLKELLARSGFRTIKLSFGHDLLGDMVSFKFSVLQWLGIWSFSRPRPKEVLESEVSLLRMLRKILVMVANAFFILCSVLLAVMKKGDSFMYYCEAALNKDENS